MLSSQRLTKSRKAGILSLPLLPTAVCQEGGIVVFKDGTARQGAVAVGLVFVGVCEEFASGPNGDERVKVRRIDAHLFDNDAVYPLTISDIATAPYILDDHTVSAEVAGRSQSGLIIDVDADGVWIMVQGA